jgi:2-polyprenyl-6-methoxyphenol hydroxylase-like FAD-dependent oxidoreductase
MAQSAESSHIIIIGAGITGLLLAQALREQSLPCKITFSIFERDDHPLARGAGWGVTLHWALKEFKELLPQYLVDRLDEAFVDRDSMARKDYGKFLFFNLETGKYEYMVPASLERYRFSRERLRTLLMDGLDIQVSKPD